MSRNIHRCHSVYTRTDVSLNLVKPVLVQVALVYTDWIPYIMYLLEKNYTIIIFRAQCF